MARRRRPAQQPRETPSPKPPARDAAGTFIAERALLSGLVGLVPVPFADDLLLGRARRTLLRDVARRCGFELDATALDQLTAAPSGQHRKAAGGWLVGRVLRRAALPLRLYDRGREALVSFQRATLLDHYLRSGGTITSDDIATLRARMDAAATRVPLSSLRGLEQHAVALRDAFDQR